MVKLAASSEERSFALIAQARQLFRGGRPMGRVDVPRPSNAISWAESKTADTTEQAEEVGTAFQQFSGYK
jgi:hypothetical protein